MGYVSVRSLGSQMLMKIIVKPVAGIFGLRCDQTVTQNGHDQDQHGGKLFIWISLTEKKNDWLSEKKLLKLVKTQEKKIYV